MDGLAPGRPAGVDVVAMMGARFSFWVAFFAALVFSSISFSTRAETIAATANTTHASPTCGGSAASTSKATACGNIKTKCDSIGAFASFGGVASSTLSDPNGGAYADGLCLISFGNGSQSTSYLIPGASSYSCPDSSWTLSGTTCTRPDCAAGEFRDPTQAYACKKDCTAMTGQSTPSGYYGTSSENWTGTVSGCQIQCSKLSSLVISGSTSAIMTGCKYTGKTSQASDPNVTAETPPNPNNPKGVKDCLGSGMGYISSSSGVTTCVPAQDAPAENRPKVEEKAVKESGTAAPDGKPDTTSPDYKKQETSTTSNGGSITTSTKETINGSNDGNGNITCPAGYTKNADNTCSKTMATTQKASDYCAENPNATICKGDKPTTDTCKDFPNRAGCSDLGDTSGADSSVLATQSKGVTDLSVISFASSDSCPADIPLPKGAALSFRWPCDLASGLKPILLALAWLSAGLIVMGAFKNG